MKYSKEALGDFSSLEENISRARAAAEMGITIESYHLTMGKYDAVVISEAPDNETLAKFVLAIAARGRFSIQTLPAFDEETAVGLASGG